MAQIGAGAGVVMTSLEGDIFEYAIRSRFKALKDKTEYEAAIARINLSTATIAKRVTIDSQLITS